MGYLQSSCSYRLVSLSGLISESSWIRLWRLVWHVPLPKREKQTHDEWEPVLVPSDVFTAGMNQRRGGEGSVTDEKLREQWKMLNCQMEYLWERNPLALSADRRPQQTSTRTKALVSSQTPSDGQMFHWRSNTSKVLFYTCFFLCGAQCDPWLLPDMILYVHVHF